MYQPYISHHGIDGQKWGVRNGPPYPLKKSMSQRVGEKRAAKRMDYIDKRTKKDAASASVIKQLSTLKMEELRNQARTILEDENRSESFGKQTIRNRAISFSAGHTAGIGLAFIMGTAAAAPISVALGSAAIPIGASWLYYKYSTR